MEDFAFFFKKYWWQILTLIVGGYEFWYVFGLATQPLLEEHAFRQTQTALSAYWMMEEGWKLGYETPVGGYPWTIPFEFPIYQSIVALVASIFNFSLDATGRMISFLFLQACIWPAWLLVKKLNLKKEVTYVFSILLWTSPLYLFWGRSFMIETTALFFTLLSLAYGIDLLKDQIKVTSVIFFTLFSTLGELQKITTIAPVLLVLGLVLAIDHVKRNGWTLPLSKKIVLVSIAFILPLVISIAWLKYSDSLKELSVLGDSLTSKALSGWNYGTIEQKMDTGLLKEIIWNRVIRDNVGASFGIGIIILSLVIGSAKERIIMFLGLLLFLLPIFIFTNLHFIHTYYQTSCAVFIIASLSIAIVIVLPKLKIFSKLPIFPISFVVILLLNLFTYNKSYAHIPRIVFDKIETRPLSIGFFVERATDPKSAMVVYGNDWSSDVAYYSKRKSFTVPHWYFWESVWHNPENFVGDLELGCMVFILNGEIALKDVLARKEVISKPYLYKINESSYVWLPREVQIPKLGFEDSKSPEFFPNVLDSLQVLK